MYCLRIGAWCRELTDNNGNSHNNTKAKNLEKFINNTITDGGYWLARYEANNDTKAKSKYDKNAWVSITQQDAATAARNMKSSGTYQSDLVNSYAWDTAIMYIEKSGNTGYSYQGPTYSSNYATGRSGDKVCNIYNMSDGMREWSTETNGSSNCDNVMRGGDCNSPTSYASLRSATANEKTTWISFRCVLYRE